MAARKSFGKGSATEPGTEANAEPKAATTPAAEPTETPEPTEVPQPQPQPQPTHSDLLTELEARGVYREAGPLYGAVNHIGDAGLEVGIVTGKGADKQRSGVGIYLRVDHLSKRFASKDIMDLIDN